MAVKRFESREAYEAYYENREHKTGVFDYVHAHGKHNIDAEIKARSEKEARAKLIKAIEECGLTCGFDDGVYNECVTADNEVVKIEVEELFDGLYYVNYIVSELWA